MIEPRIQFLEERTIERVIDEAYQLLLDPGVKCSTDQPLKLFAEAGADVDFSKRVARIPARLIDEARKSVPSEVVLYDLPGNPRLSLGGDKVHFHPLSAAMTVWDQQTDQLRPPVTADLVKFIKVAEGLPGVDTLGSIFYCNDVAPEVVDAYRMYVLLKYATKPFITGGFTVEGQRVMNDMARAFRGGPEALGEKPMLVMSAAASATLKWGFTADLLIECSRARIPTLICSMPIGGVAGPMTLIGSIVQDTAEVLSGVVLSQLAQPGAPILWQTGISLFDMQQAAPPYGSIETLMANCGVTEVGKYLGFPTMNTMGLSDSKTVDAQQAIESTAGILLAALCRVNLASGMGMLASMTGHSCESLVISHEAVGMARRLLEGINDKMDSFGLELIRQVGHEGNFLETEHTAQWFKKESYFSMLMDRQSEGSWRALGAKDMLARAREKVEELVASYKQPELPQDVAEEIDAIMGQYAAKYGMEELPSLDI